MKILPCVLVCAAAAGLAPRVALANPVTITAGSLSTYYGGDPTSINMSGLGLSVSSDVGANATSGFSAGEMADLNGYFEFNNITHPANVVVDNVSYSAWLTGGGSFATTPFVAPPTDPGITFVDFRTPFVFTGLVQGYATRDHTGPPLFDFDLTGTGTASAHTLATDGQYVTRFGVGYVFEASPTPEPSSLLLLGTCLGGLAVFAWKRGHRSPTAR